MRNFANRKNLVTLLFLGLLTLEQIQADTNTPAQPKIHFLSEGMKPVFSTEELEDAQGKKKDRHKLESKAYKSMNKLSPFYLDHHPEAR